GAKPRPRPGASADREPRETHPLAKHTANHGRTLSGGKDYESRQQIASTDRYLEQGVIRNAVPAFGSLLRDSRFDVRRTECISTVGLERFFDSGMSPESTSHVTALHDKRRPPARTEPLAPCG